MARQLQVSLLGGSLASVAWHLLGEIAGTYQPQFPFDPCPTCPLIKEGWTPDPESVLLGVGLGLLLGPLVDLVYLVRLWWVALVREHVRALQAAAASRFVSRPCMDDTASLLRQFGLSLQALSLEVHRQGQDLRRVLRLLEEQQGGFEVVSGVDSGVVPPSIPSLPARSTQPAQSSVEHCHLEASPAWFRLW